MKINLRRALLSVGYVVFCALGLFISFLPYAPDAHLAVKGTNDFTPLYVAARLMGTPDLYNSDAGLREQVRIHGVRCTTVQYVRLPYYAALLWPLGRLDFRAAYWLWQALSLVGLAGFILLWPGRPHIACAVFCWSVPLMSNFLNGQDVTFLLLYVAGVAWLVRRERPFAAGLLLSLCAAKIHLFLFVPLLLVRRRMWRTMAGLAAGGAALLTASFVVAGANWPAEYIRLVTNPAIHSPASSVSSALYAAVRALAPGSPLPGIAVGVLVAALAAVVWRFGAALPFPYALAAAVAASVPVPGHIYTHDYLLVMPLVLCFLDDMWPRPVMEVKPAAGCAAAAGH